jgi:L-alanine-DL-glutamate epimerase-like enolase superfamily enzyme
VQIERVEVIPIRAPRKEVVRSGTGANPVTHSEFGIVRIVAEGGLDGAGEISITAPRIGHTLCHAAADLIAPEFVGMDPRGFPRVLTRIDRLLGGELSAPYLRAAFEMALLDLVGKHYEIPVYQMIGGKVREEVPLAWGIYQKSPDDMAADARAGIEAGFQAIKLKVGRALADDLAAVRAVTASVGPEIPLRLDANAAWRSVAEAARAIDALAGAAPIAWVEQPLRRDDLDGLRLLREQSGVPIMADESLQTLRDAYDVARAQAADVWNVYVVEAGGLLPASHILGLAETLGIPCILGSQAELGIGTAAAAHLGVASAALAYPSETFGPLRYERDIVTSGATIANGALRPADRPGLGLDLDWETIEMWRVG